MGSGSERTTLWRALLPTPKMGTRITMTELVARLRAALLGRYTIERELGRGGMATVYLGQDLKHHRAVAIKVLRPELAAALGPERFVREIEIAAGLTHPHILPLHDSGEADGFLYYVRSEEHTSELQSRLHLVCRLLLEKKKKPIWMVHNART